MFRVMPMCRFIILSVAGVAGLALWLFTRRRIVMILAIAGTFWLWLYTAGLKVEVSEKYIVRHTGNIFKRESIILLKNVFHIQVITLFPWRPAVIRLHGYGETIVVFGLDGRQATFVKKAVKGRYKY